MRNELCAAALLASLTATSASADILQANFAGTTGANAGTYSAGGSFGCPIVTISGCTFAGAPFTATFIFDTSLGVLSSPSTGTIELTGGLVSDILTVTGVGSFSNTGGDVNALEWQVDSMGQLALIGAVAQDSGGFRNIDLFEPHAFFQSGTCPGLPCSLLFITSESLTNLSPVPSPAVGAGLPGMIFACAGLGWWRRRRKMQHFQPAPCAH